MSAHNAYYYSYYTHILYYRYYFYFLYRICLRDISEYYLYAYYYIIHVSVIIIVTKIAPWTSVINSFNDRNDRDNPSWWARVQCTVFFFIFFCFVVYFLTPVHYVPTTMNTLDSITRIYFNTPDAYIMKSTISMDGPYITITSIFLFSYKLGLLYFILYGFICTLCQNNYKFRQWHTYKFHGGMFEHLNVSCRSVTEFSKILVLTFYNIYPSECLIF